MPSAPIFSVQGRTEGRGLLRLKKPATTSRLGPKSGSSSASLRLAFASPCPSMQTLNLSCAVLRPEGFSWEAHNPTHLARRSRWATT